MIAPGVFLPPWKLVETSLSGGKPGKAKLFGALPSWHSYLPDAYVTGEVST
jgi:hypothetical protein